MVKGKQSVLFDKPLYIEETASVVGQKEGEGPLKDYFDIIEKDPVFGGNDWEEAESKLIEKTIDKLLIKAKRSIDDISTFMQVICLDSLLQARSA